MTDLITIKIHDGIGAGLVLLDTPETCCLVYEHLANTFGDDLVIIDLSNLPNPLEIVQGQAQARDVLFCLKTTNFHPGDITDVQRWLSNHNISNEILTYCGDLWVVVDVDYLNNTHFDNKVVSMNQTSETPVENVRPRVRVEIAGTRSGCGKSSVAALIIQALQKAGFDDIKVTSQSDNIKEQVLAGVDIARLVPLPGIDVIDRYGDVAAVEDDDGNTWGA
jgi:hypothetical protein